MATNQFTVEADSAGQRLDNFLLKVLKNIPKSRIYKAVRKGEVRVQGKRASPMQKLVLGDVVRVPPFMTAPAAQTPLRASTESLNQLKAAILYEDDALLVLNKPAGWAVHSGSGQGLGIIEALNQTSAQPLYLVHRLDRLTSGCLLMTKSREILVQIQRVIANRGMTKQYQCIVQGRFPAEIKEIEAPLLRIDESVRRKVIVSPQGKPALTRILERSCYRDVSLLTLGLETGRMHQIRVHCAYVGHPVIGDPRYGEDAVNKEYENKGLPGMCLHASQLILPNIYAKPLQFEAPLPERMEKILMAS